MRMACVTPSKFAGHSMLCHYECNGTRYIEERSFDCVRAPAQTAGKATTRANSAQDDGDGMTGISFWRKGILAAAQSTMVSPERPNMAAVAWLGSTVRLKGMPTV